MFDVIYLIVLLLLFAGSYGLIAFCARQNQHRS